ncbi:hypothetical protein AB7C87_12000 [Natrarchaeobius sp. A-rgal3]|uniref:DUF7344 domain-containing protein n=1 Tax=Natrarchaeobius versutus TaxID=1679078 RepID=UPI00350F9A12
MNTTTFGDRSGTPRGGALESLGDARQCAVLRLVYERSSAGISKTDLAYELAAVTNDKPPDDVTNPEYRREQVDCHHRLLPALIEVGLLEESGDGIVTTDHPIFDTLVFEAIVEGRLDGLEDDLETLIDALADSTRRLILTVLDERDRPIGVEPLARSLAARTNSTRKAISDRRLERLRTALVHVHLPVLADADLVEYDVATDRISTGERRSFASDRSATESDSSPEGRESTSPSRTVGKRGNV